MAPNAVKAPFRDHLVEADFGIVLCCTGTAIAANIGRIGELETR